MKKCYFLVVIFLLFQEVTLAQKYETENFVSQRKINDILYDDNSIYFATDGGILQLDLSGTIIRTYLASEGLNANQIISLGMVNGSILASSGNVDLLSDDTWASLDYPGFGSEGVAGDASGNVWVTDDQGIWQFSSGSWTQYTHDYVFDSDIIYGSVLTATNNKVYLGGKFSEGLLEFDGSSWSTITGLENNKITDLQEDALGTVYIGTQINGLYTYDGVELSQFSNAFTNVNSVAIGASDNIWVANFQGAWHYNGVDWTLNPTLGGLVVNGVDVVKHINGKFWFGYDEGYSIYDGDTWTHFQLGTVFLSNDIGSITFDGEEKAWVATGAGLNSRPADGNWADESIINLRVSDEFGVASATAFNNDILWITAQDKLLRKSGFEYTVYTDTLPGNYGDNQYSSISIINDQVAVASEKRFGDPEMTAKVLLYNQVSDDFDVLLEGEGINNIKISEVFWSNEDSLWVITGGDPLVYTLSTQTAMSPFFTSFGTRSVCKDNNNKLWFGSSSDYILYKYDGNTMTRFELSEYDPNFESQAFNPEITTLESDKYGNVWLGTRGDGLFKFDGNTWLNISTKDGLVGNSVNHIEAQDDSTLWIGTTSGLSILSLQSNSSPVISTQSFQLDENNDPMQFVGKVLATDVDDTEINIALSEGGIADNENFILRNDSLFSLVSFDAESETSKTVEVVATDPFGARTLADIIISINNINDNAPLASEDTYSIDENLANGSLVGTVTATDLDGDALTFSITAGNSLGAFQIEQSSGSITVANSEPLDFESNPTFELSIEVSDGELSDLANIIISISNINDNAPLASDDTYSIDENLANGTLVGTVTATDLDGDALIFSITAGNSLGAFQIEPNSGSIYVANSEPLDFETNPTFELLIEVSDGELSDEATISVALNDLDDDVLGIKDQFGKEIKLYPNPTYDFVNIQWNTFKQATISELSGKELFKSATRTLDLRTLKAGVYLINLESANNERITFRIIKE